MCYNINNNNNYYYYINDYIISHFNVITFCKINISLHFIVNEKKYYLTFSNLIYTKYIKRGAHIFAPKHIYTPFNNITAVAQLISTLLLLVINNGHFQNIYVDEFN